MDARLYVIPGSHPSMAARLMLEAKGIDYKRTDLLPVVSKGALKAFRFPGTTVPALKLDGRKVQGTGKIARALDEVVPAPQIVPTDPAERARVEEVEAFGDTTLQEVARRTFWNAVSRDKSPLRSFSEGARLGIPVGLAVKTAAPIVAAAKRINEGDDAHLKADMEALPAHLDTIDGWIADGRIGSEQANIGDYQIAPSLRLLMSLDDVKPYIENRPAGKLAMRVAPDYPGRVPPILPAEFLEPLRTAAAVA